MDMSPWLRDLHEPAAYFGRLDGLYLDAGLNLQRTRRRHLRAHPVKRLVLSLRLLGEALGIFARPMRHVPDGNLRREYRRRLWQVLKRWREPLGQVGHARNIFERISCAPSN